MFTVTRTGGRTLTSLGVTAYIGATRFDRFSLDLAVRPHPATPVDRRRPKPVIDLLSLADLPEFTLYPLPDQVADKVCAMYASYGVPPSPSTRYRDLVDLLLIITTCSLAAEPTIAALHSEANRRRLTLPQQILPPGPRWSTGYAQTARDTSLSRTLHDLNTALATVGDCLNPLLGEAVTSGQWDPHQRRWTP
ncbi:MAG: nucleotidyl transferase AbiEii/AbiGii toxin family protein [Nocardioidaceae bacterium]